MKKRMKYLLHWLGVDLIHVGHGERFIASLGALLGIASCWGISSQFVGPESAALIVASMGAGAVLLFAVPHGALSQPWSAVGGHLLPAIVGVSCAQWIDATWLAGALAVGLAVLVMHYGRCLHPPGGATALVAVIGGPDIRALGFGYVLEPVLLNALVLFGFALLFNNLIASHRYPAVWAQSDTSSEQSSPSGIRAEHVRAALTEMDLVEDISEDDLLHIISRAETFAAQQRVQKEP
ncbi:MAG: HPP family protein [Mariprofundus sp.]